MLLSCLSLNGYLILFTDRFQSEPQYQNVTAQQQTSYGAQAKDFAKPIDSSSFVVQISKPPFKQPLTVVNQSSSFLASQTDPYTSQRRFSGQNGETTTQPPPLYQSSGYQTSLGGSQIHNAAPTASGLYQNSATQQYGASSQASSMYGAQGAQGQGVQGSFRENQSSYRRDEFTPPPPGFVPSNLPQSSAAMPPVPARLPSAASLLSRTTTTTGSGPTMMSYEQRTVTRTASVPTLVAPPPPMISARQGMMHLKPYNI